MPTHSIRYFVADSFLGESLLDSIDAPRSLAYFCTTCGDIWARTIVNAGDFWDCLLVPCSQHQPRHNADNNSLPGSLLFWQPTQRLAAMMWWAGVIDFLPRAVLEREFLLHTSDSGVRRVVDCDYWGETDESGNA